MARNRNHEEHENHERWLVSYADFITLLFAFFVVMYSISSVNEGKFRVVSESIEHSFSPVNRALKPIQFGPLARDGNGVPSPLRSLPILQQEAINLDIPRTMRDHAIPLTPQTKERVQQDTPEMEKLANELHTAFDTLIANKLMLLRKNEYWTEIEINSNILFPSGSGDLALEATPILRKVAKILQGRNNRVHVEGFTDNRPIKNQRFPSNWELSAARAAAVVRLFGSLGVPPQNMASIGYGEHRPKADNATAAGRAANRRVVVVIHAADAPAKERRVVRAQR